MNCRVGIIIKHGYNQRPRQLKIYQKLVYVILIYEANSLTVLTVFETFKKLKTQNSFMISFSKNKINLPEKKILNFLLISRIEKFYLSFVFMVMIMNAEKILH